MIPSYVRGCIANVFTCFNEDLSLDDVGQRNFLDFLYATDAVSAFFVRSGMGQMYAYDYDDVKQMARLACAHLDGKAPVIVGTTGIWDHNPDKLPDPVAFTKEAVELSKYAEGLGAAGVVHTIPDGIAPRGGETPADVTYRYVEAIAASVKCPVLLYQPPMIRKEYWVTIDLLRRLAAIDNVVAIKISSGNTEFLLDSCWAVQGLDLSVIIGNETAYFYGLSLGCKAVIGQGCCVNPQILCAVLDRFEQGDIAGAMDAQRSVNYLCQESVSTVEFLKRYAAEKGFACKPFSRPTASNPYFTPPTPLTDADYHSYKRTLESELAKYSASLVQ